MEYVVRRKDRGRPRPSQNALMSTREKARKILLQMPFCICQHTRDGRIFAR